MRTSDAPVGLPPGLRAALVLVPLALAVAAAVAVGTRPAAGGTPDATAAPSGRELYLTQCAHCHGVDHAGVAGNGPPLLEEGAAATDYVLRTGRMPIADPDVQPSRGPVRYSEAEIQALVDYVGSIGSGPAIPAVDTSSADLVTGGRLFRLNCAACHVASGSGAVIGVREAPSLDSATPTQVGEAIVVGPGAMPVLSTGLGSEDVNDVAAYVQQLQAEESTGWSALGGVGPVAEGLAAWTLGLLPLIAVTRWIGEPREAEGEAEET